MATDASCRLAILYAYNGAHFQGLERTKGLKTVEGTLLSAVANIVGEADPTKRVSLVNISRASTTEKGEHASRQVLSLEITGADGRTPLPTPARLAALLPETIRVFDVVKLNTNFSARRTCDTRTYEYVLPTYVFAPPSAETHYAYPPLAEDELFEDLPEGDNLGPPGGLFKTIKRGMSVKRSRSTRTVNRAKSTSRREETASSMGLVDVKVAPSHFENKHQEAAPEKKGGFMKFFRTLTRSGTKSRPSETQYVNSTTLPIPEKGRNIGSSPSSHSLSHEAQYATSAPEEDFGFMSTLKRSVSRRSRRDPEIASIKDEDDVPAVPEHQYYDPLVQAPHTEEELSLIRQYRIPEDQLKAVNHIIGIYNGTHNWHNYIPGAKYEDSRCYMRILNIECSAPELHFGMEYIRVKVQAKAFARYQVRKMIAMAIMVVRTNTPRSIVANSFGYANIDIPEAPAFGLILDEPHYDTFNSDCDRRGDSHKISFHEHERSITEFRHHSIHDAIYRSELDAMQFQEWLRNLDAFSFLYTYYLNQRGVVVPNHNYVSKAAAHAEQQRVENERQRKTNGLFVQE
ncbi:pseudouridine synthase [Fimicolochytrium jonesii]|uniref:pseudouridine synthase n=1 Tax=Fimicolochytrium jonesii TaxID=1396493 RepID=UPI0022FEE909|nr:pseudouridine synthase [Fimicolochytrium jonesii]KAI8823668.1 pseudouridine synthase [Fimicolochytrium jonesii]